MLIAMNTDVNLQKNLDRPANLVQTGLILAWVQCKGYRCMAYADATGQWINFYTGKRITDFVKVIG